MSEQACIDLPLLRRYDRPGPRYTSYPTAPQFHGGFGEAQFRQAALASNEDPIPRRLSLYVHVPFCLSPCFYCGCNRVITRDRSRAQAYLGRLIAEAQLVGPLFDRDRELVQLHLGGGTPNFLAPGQIGELLEALSRHFRFSGGSQRDFSIEIDPRSIGEGDIEALAFMGFNRASLGVQDFDPDVQAAVNRLQSVSQTLAVIEDCRRSGMRSVNVDLIYGLPRQTREGFGRTLDTLIDVRPDRLAVYSYAHLPQMFKPQRRINEAELPGAEEKLGLLQLAIEKLSAAGYQYIGMDHFALPGDDLALAQSQGRLQRNFMGYTTHADCDLIGLGVSAISHVGETYSQNPRELPAWEAAIDAGRLPTWRGLSLREDDTLRAELIGRLMCQGEVAFAPIEQSFGVDFRRYFSAELERLGPLAADGLVQLLSDRIKVTPAGRRLLRVVASCFDRYLHEPAPA
jgi:oxygen-independent coproporphyrinogen-3 oxidase